MHENQPRYQHLSQSYRAVIVNGGPKTRQQRCDLQVPKPRYPAAPRCHPAGSAAKTNPAAPLTPYIYNGVAGRIGATPFNPQKQYPAGQREENFR